MKKKEILDSGLFDADWYLERNADVRMLGMDPLEHYLWLGMRLRRNPGPDFDCEQYLSAHADVSKTNYNPLMHYIRYGKAEGRQAFEVSSAPAAVTQMRSGLRRLAGDVAARQGRPVVMLCSHVAGQNLFGGERSLLDMIDGLSALGYNVVLTVPGTGNPAYLETLRERSMAVYVFSYGWWRSGVAVDDAVVARFARIITNESVDVVHTNTIVLREPLIAAQRLGVRSLVHVRELIRHDDALLRMIGASADEIVDQVWDSCDQLVVNSRATLAGFTRPGRKAALVYNTVDIEPLSQLPPPGREGLRVGLISSNIPKKGIWDFARVAQLLAESHPKVSFHLIGPDNEHTAEIFAKIASGALPSSLRLLGYRESPVEAVAETDVILSLSHFQESFGRTVLEGMAAGRAVIVYDHGAPPEFVTPGKTGFVVPVGDVAGVADVIRRLADSPDELVQIGATAQQETVVRFGREAYAEQLRSAYEGVLSSPAPARKLRLPARRNLSPHPRSAMKIAYFCWHFPVPSETFVLNELRLLKAQGIDVQVFCKQSPYPDFSPDFDISWERVRDADHLAERLTETGITCVHAHFVYPTVTDMVWPACEKAGIPFTCIAHAQDIFRYKNVGKNRINEFSRSPMCRRIFTLSRFHRRYLEARGVPGEKLFINSNCIDPELFVGGKVSDRPARKSRSICAVSRFAEKKGLEQLIRAGKLLEKDGITINIYGYGELEDLYHGIIAEQKVENVHLHGPVKGRDALMEVFRQHDLFACPSVRAQDGDMDGIPTTLMESMAAGLPVLTTAVAGIPDLVSHRVTGLVCEATPEAIAEKIRSFYALPDSAVAAMIQRADDRLRRNHNGPDLVENLVRVWANETIDLMIVSWNNLAQISEVIRRLYKYTSLPFHLIICDNGSDAPALAHLMEVYGKNDNVTILLNRDNAFVGPGTNLCLAEGRSDYAIYVCGKEGMTTRHGWEKPFVHYMDAHPEVGQAGTLCYSPSYLHGRDYPTGQALFGKFRNPEFAQANPDRVFSHVQGGFFVLRRKMIDKIGGFSDDVPHSSTDVEFSYYVESCGWELGEVPGLMALFNKTRPGLVHRVDETMGALHPPMLEDLPMFDAIARGEVHHCNACGEQSESFSDLDGVAHCPKCGAGRRARSLHRVLAESILLYRRLPALGVNVPPALRTFWSQQFQGRVFDSGELARELAEKGRADFANGRLQLVMLNGAIGADPEEDERLLTETARVLAPEGALLVLGCEAAEELTSRLETRGFALQASKRYSSSVSHYDWLPVLVYTRRVVEQ